MKLKTQFEFVEIGDEITAVPVGENSFSGVIVVNKTKQDIMKLLETETTEEAVISAMCEMYSADRDTIANGVCDVLRALSENSML